MDMVFHKKEIPCMSCVLREVQNSEQTQELRLPDGMPDIGKVLCAWGQTVLRGKEWRSDSILVSGGMMMWVLYLPEDSSEPQVLNGWLPFQMRWTLPEGCSDGSIRVSALTRFADARSVSARKLMLRAGIGIQAEVWTVSRIERWEPEQLPEQIELLHRRYPVRLTREAGEKDFTMEEELTPGGQPGKLLYYTLRPEITEMRVLTNKIAFRGSGNLHAVWLDEGGNVQNQDYALPFSQFAELAGSFSSDAQTDVHCCVTDLELTPDENGSLQLKCSLTAQYLVDDQQILETVEDAYAPGVSLRLEQQEVPVPAILEKRTELCTADAAAAGGAVQILDTCFLPDFPHLYREDDGIAVEVPGTVQMLCLDSDGSLRSSSCRWEGKRRLAAGEDSQLRVTPLTPPIPTVNAAGSETLVHAELPMQYLSFAGQGISMVTEVEIGEALQPDPQRPSLILRRACGESLWEIAKICGSTRSAIRTANSLEDDPRPGQMLLIPVC